MDKLREKIDNELKEFEEKTKAKGVDYLFNNALRVSDVQNVGDFLFSDELQTSIEDSAYKALLEQPHLCETLVEFNDHSWHPHSLVDYDDISELVDEWIDANVITPKICTDD